MLTDLWRECTICAVFFSMSLMVSIMYLLRSIILSLHARWSLKPWHQPIVPFPSVAIPLNTLLAYLLRLWHTGIIVESTKVMPVHHPKAPRLRKNMSWKNTRLSNSTKRLYGKLFADKGYISQKLFDFLFDDGIQLVTWLRVNMKNKLMPFYDRMMLRKRYIIETINDMLKNTAQIVHSRHRSVSNFIMNLVSALGAYCSFDNKPKALQGYCIEDTKQLTLF